MQLLFAILLAASPPTRLAALERSLNAAIPDDKPIVLKEGDDFEAAPGTVIFLSREEGAMRLIAMAREGKDELSLFFLPRHKAWVTEAVIRTVDITSADTAFCLAAMKSEPYVELWHFHNNIGIPRMMPPPDFRQASMMWTVPSELDLEEMYAWAEQEPKAEFRGFVASIYGIMEYWSDSYPVNVPPQYLRPALVSEARLMKMKAKDATALSLVEVVRSHRGIFWYRFRPVP